MARKRYTPEQIIAMPEEAEIRLRKAVSDLTPDALILKDAVKGKY